MKRPESDATALADFKCALDHAAIVAEVHRHGVGTLTPDPRNLEPIARLLPMPVG